MNEPQANSALRKLNSSICSLLIAFLVFYAMPVEAQVAPTAPPQGLRIMILSGEGALNNIEARTAREPIVEVEDQNHKPVAGAVVLFTIHGGKNGAGGSFQNGSTTLSTVTNAAGIAMATGFQPNSNSGAWQVTVTASYGSLTASTVINEINELPEAPHQQTNTLAPNSTLSPISVQGPTHFGHGFMHLQWFLTKPGMLVAGAVVVASVITVIVVTKPANPTQISTGTSTVGAPTARGAQGLTIHF